MLISVITVSAAWAADEELSAQNPAPIPAHQATYDVFFNGKPVGEIHFQLEKANEAVWYVRTESKATAFLAKTLGSEVTEASHFYWSRHTTHPKLIPLTYHHVSKEPLRTRFWQHRIDWQTATSQTATHEGDEVISLPEGVLDPLTLRLQLASDLKHSSAPDLDRHYVVLDRDDIEKQTVLAKGKEQITVEAGCFETHHFYRFRKEGSSRNYDLWLSPSLYWMPVKMKQTDGSREISIELRQTDLTPSDRACVSTAEP